MAASATAAQAADVYGQVRMSVDKIDSSAADADRWTVNDRVSRIGVKGSEDLGGGMSAVYGLEWGVAVDNADNTLTYTNTATTGTVASQATSGISARNQFVGLKGAFGTVLIGRHDAPYKLAGTADLFNDTAADASNNSNANGATIIGRNGFDTRASQTVAYITPDFNGLHAAVAMIPGEETGADAANGLADAWSATVIYKNGPLNASVSHQKYSKQMDNGSFTSMVFDADADTITTTAAAATAEKAKAGTKFNIGYEVAGVKLGYTHESSNSAFANGNSKDKGQLASIAYPMGPITLAYQYGKFDSKAAADADLTTNTLGVVYALSKRTSAYAAYADIDNKPAATADLKIVTMGLNHSF